MLSNILISLGSCISAVIGWFDNLTDATGTWGIILSVIIMFMVARLIINPFIGAAIRINASDGVKQIKNDAYKASKANSKGGKSK